MGIRNILVRAIKLCDLIVKIPDAMRIADQPSYYPEQKRKKVLVRRWENLRWLIRYHEINEYYNLYGLDAVGSDESKYKDYYHFMYERNIMNKLGEADGAACFLRDKYMFYRCMRALELPTPEVFAVIRNGRIYDAEMQERSEDLLTDRTDYFIKGMTGECASFVVHVQDWDEFQKLKPRISKGHYLCQKRIYQNAEMASLYSGSINTLRVITVYNDGNPIVLSAILRMGTTQTGNVDNWAAGGVSASVDLNTGRVSKFGFYKPKYGTKTGRHPDSNILFADFVVPHFDEILNLSILAQKKFWFIETIGWDIALTDDGVTFIEGNDNWEISMVQALDRPLREEWGKIVKHHR